MTTGTIVPFRVSLRRTLLASLIAWSATGCAEPDLASLVATGSLLEQAVTDATFVGAMTDGTSICLYHAPDGRFLGRANGLISGTWSIEEDTVCYTYTTGAGPSACQQAVIGNDRAAFFVGEELVGQGRFNEGNICA